jgi:iron only hydrogenase large subunit-like protein
MKLKLFRFLFPDIYYEYLNLKTYSEFTKYVKENPDKLVPTMVYSSVCPHWLLHLVRNQRSNKDLLPTPNNN